MWLNVWQPNNKNNINNNNNGIINIIIINNNNNNNNSIIINNNNDNNNNNNNNKRTINKQIGSCVTTNLLYRDICLFFVMIMALVIFQILIKITKSGSVCVVV